MKIHSCVGTCRDILNPKANLWKVNSLDLGAVAQYVFIAGVQFQF